jgi:hypothetical protein
MTKSSKPRLLFGCIILALSSLILGYFIFMVKFYDDRIGGFTFLPTSTPLPLELGEEWPTLEDKQRIVVEGILSYYSTITTMDLGSYGWRDKLYLTNPVNGEEIGIWFETTLEQEKLPNHVKTVPFNFRHEDIWVYDNQSQVVYPGDWVRVEGRILSNNSNLGVEKVELLQSYPQISHSDGYVGPGEQVQLIDIRWLDDVLLIVYESPEEFGVGFRLDVAGIGFTCRDINSYRLFCSGRGAASGEGVLVSLFKVPAGGGDDELLHSEEVRIP